MNVELLWITPNAERVIELSGRTAYQSQDKISDGSARRFIRSIIRSGHESVVEHGVASFVINGVSRVLTHQLVRHRLASYTQKSGRYCEGVDIKIIHPPTVKADKIAYEAALWVERFLQWFYGWLRKRGISKEDARYYSPFGHDTEIVMTCDFREWRHFLKLRLDKHAQWEIRELACGVLDELYSHAPSVFEDIMAGVDVD